MFHIMLTQLDSVSETVLMSEWKVNSLQNCSGSVCTQVTRKSFP